MSPDVSIVSGNLRGQSFPCYYWPLFVGHGTIPTLLGHVLPGRLRVQPDAELLFVHGRGIHAGRNCVVLRTHAVQFSTTSFDEFWVDPARDSAVLRLACYAGGHPASDLEIAYQETSHGWLPQRWTLIVRPGGRTAQVERMRVEEVTINPPCTDAAFRVDIKPGMRISETKFGGSPDQLGIPPTLEEKTHRVADDGRWNPIVDGVEQARRWTDYAWWGLLALLGAGLGLWVLARRRRVHPGRPRS
jgi:hypothetical protein